MEKGQPDSGSSNIKDGDVVRDSTVHPRLSALVSALMEAMER